LTSQNDIDFQIYSYDRSEQDALFLNFTLVKPLHVSDRLTALHQES